MYMDDNKILKIICDYVNDERIKQAVLIDGQWGSGKTFFIQDKLIKKLEENKMHKEIINISLYGVESEGQISKSILIKKLMPEKIKGKKIIYKGAKILSKLTNAGMGMLNIDSDKLPNLGDIFDFNNFIIIFDDLERCNMDINKLFGYINNLLEQSNAKVIIVSNQSEIGCLNLSVDLPQKYSVVLNEQLNLNEDMEKATRDKINKQKLQELTNELFAEDVIYERIKEKVIGLTIQYQAKLDLIYSDLIEKYVNHSGTKNYLIDKKNEIIEIFTEQNHTNIRTFIFALISYEHFFKLFDDIQFDQIEYLNEQKNLIMEYTFTVAIKIKNGTYEYPWNKSSTESGMVYWNDNKYHLYGKKTYGYKFVDEYLMFRKFDKNNIIQLINNLMSEKRVANEQQIKESLLAVNKLSEWYELEDSEINELIEKLKEELVENSYDCNRYKDIILVLMHIESYDISKIEYNDYITPMKNNIKNTKGKIDENRFQILTDDYELNKKYDKITEPLIREINKINSKWLGDFNEYFNGAKAWDDHFVLICTKHCHDFRDKHRFFSYMNIDKVFNKLKNGTTKDIRCFIKGIENVYDFSNLADFYISDTDNVERLLETINEHMDIISVKTKQLAVDQLKMNLEKYSNSLKRRNF